MKQMGSFSKLVALGLVLAAVFFVNPAQAVTNAGTQQGQAKVTKINGNATYQSAGQSGVLKVGQILTAGASISTGPAATVELSLGVNGQSLTIKPDSTVAIEQLDFKYDGEETVVNTRLNLTKGGLNGNVKKLAANSKYEIKTANGVAGVRGTSYSISSNGTVAVYEGTVYVTYTVAGRSKQFVVHKGKRLRPPTDPGGEPTMEQFDASREDAGDQNGPNDKRIIDKNSSVFVSPVTGRGRRPIVPPTGP